MVLSIVNGTVTDLLQYFPGFPSTMMTKTLQVTGTGFSVPNEGSENYKLGK